MYDRVCYLTMCVSVCPDGFYGEDCLEQCECHNGGHCNHETGTCECQAGWHGRMCEKGRTCTRIHRHLVTGHIRWDYGNRYCIHQVRVFPAESLDYLIHSCHLSVVCYCKHCQSIRRHFCSVCSVIMLDSTTTWSHIEIHNPGFRLFLIYISCFSVCGVTY